MRGKTGMDGTFPSFSRADLCHRLGRIPRPVLRMRRRSLRRGRSRSAVFSRRGSSQWRGLLCASGMRLADLAGTNSFRSAISHLAPFAGPGWIGICIYSFLTQIRADATSTVGKLTLSQRQL